MLTTAGISQTDRLQRAIGTQGSFRAAKDSPQLHQGLIEPSRLPGGDEADDAYAAYYRQMLAALDPLPTTVLAMAAESVDFQSIFSTEA